MKAILIIDMPSNCAECPCGYDDFYCQQKYKELNEKVRPKWCPLKPMPLKYKDYQIADALLLDEYKAGKLIGWNACLEEIEE